MKQTIPSVKSRPFRDVKVTTKGKLTLNHNWWRPLKVWKAIQWQSMLFLGTSNITQPMTKPMSGHASAIKSSKSMRMRLRAVIRTFTVHRWYMIFKLQLATDWRLRSACAFAQLIRTLTCGKSHPVASLWSYYVDRQNGFVYVNNRASNMTLCQTIQLLQ